MLLLYRRLSLIIKLKVEKGGCKVKYGDLSRNGCLPYYIEVFLEIHQDAAKSLCVYHSFVNKHVQQKNYLDKI